MRSLRSPRWRPRGFPALTMASYCLEFRVQSDGVEGGHVERRVWLVGSPRMIASMGLPRPRQADHEAGGLACARRLSSGVSTTARLRSPRRCLNTSSRRRNAGNISESRVAQRLRRDRSRRSGCRSGATPEQSRRLMRSETAMARRLRAATRSLMSASRARRVLGLDRLAGWGARPRSRTAPAGGKSIRRRTGQSWRVFPWLKEGSGLTGIDLTQGKPTDYRLLEEAMAPVA
jgi:hypothetical protein